MQIILSDELTQKLQHIAQLRQQPIEQLVMERLQQLLDERLSQLPTVEQTELEALAYLSNDTLRVIADEQLPNQAQQRMAALMSLNSAGRLTPNERSELARLVERGDQLMLRKAEAHLLLQQRSFAHNANYSLSSND